MPLRFADPIKNTVPLSLITADQLDDWLAQQDDATRSWVVANGFRAAAGSALVLPGPEGGLRAAVGGLGKAESRRRRRFLAAKIRAGLPAATYILANAPEGDDLSECALGWLFGGYRFNRYRDQKPPQAQLVVPKGIDADRLMHIAAGEALTRDLINTPSSDMGPDELEAEARTLAEAYEADISVISGDDLLTQNFPLIHAVGRASPRAPRLIDMTWGSAGPVLTLVGKGVVFDTGGLNLKPGASMGLMKKDMGGAAAVLGLARMIMGLGLSLRLRVLLPVAENAVSGASFRPGDILTARNGLTVEINNTDAEGRLVLADALALAAEGDSDLTISMATLTGAARVAVGPDLAPFFCDDIGFAEALRAAADKVRDPVWQLPFHEPYEAMIEPGIADLDNAPSGGFAGAITAALFLRRFAGAARYAHFDIYGWQPKPAPGRPKGGVGQGTRAILDALPEVLDL